MKFSTVILAGITSAAETNDTAIVSLNKLHEIGMEILSSPSIDQKRAEWKHKWARKIRINGDRMRMSFQRCGTKYDEADDEIDVEYDIDNPCGAIKELLNGYSNWTSQYISECNGQRNRSHQQNRFQRWNNMWKKGTKV